MKLSRGRVLRQAELGAGWVPVEFAFGAGGVERPRGQLVPRAVMEAGDTAHRILQAAQQRAQWAVAEAEQHAQELRARAEAEGRAEAVARLAARELRLAQHEARAEERALDRTIALARVLAERLLGDQLDLDPSRVVDLARQALLEARGARSIVIFAHPDEVAMLSGALAAQSEDEPIRVRADPERPRGNIRIETELGALDAELAPQLDRLAAKLRESLRHGT